jgi:hypothetical protein
VNSRSPSIFGKVSDQSLVLIWKYCSDHSLLGNPSLFGIVANLLNLTKQSLYRYPIGTCLDQKTRVQNTFACHNRVIKILSLPIEIPSTGLASESRKSVIWREPQNVLDIMQILFCPD